VSSVDARTKQFSWNLPFVKDFPVQTDRSARAETMVAGVPGKQPAHSSVIPMYVQVRDEIRMCQLRG
jgi:hypothetical protein